jgi:polyisoprenoid-binding protein YceI
MTTQAQKSDQALSVEQFRWRLDTARSRVAFRTENFWGLTGVHGHFDRYYGVLDLAAPRPIELTIDADSLDTNNRRRDKHLRSSDFFDVGNAPYIRYVADDVRVDGTRLTAHGALVAAGTSVPVDVEARLKQVDGEAEVDAVAEVDHRALGMTWSPLRMVAPTTTLIVRGRLVKDTLDEELGHD